MDLLNDVSESSSNKKSFLSHVFSATEEGKAEIFNVSQYALLGVIPIVILNKLIHRFIPEADPDKSSLELIIEIFIQLIVMFCGIILIHRIITYVPTYSGFKYESLTLTHVILAFLVIVLSIQTKLGIKVNILFDRLGDLWNGSGMDVKGKVRNQARVNTSLLSGGGVSAGGHTPSQADYLDSASMQQDMFPPAPVATTNKGSSGSYGGSPVSASNGYSGPMAANSVLGGAFGTAF
jgi:hypothetical protein